MYGPLASNDDGSPLFAGFVPLNLMSLAWWFCGDEQASCRGSWPEGLGDVLHREPLPRKEIFDDIHTARLSGVVN